MSEFQATIPSMVVQDSYLERLGVFEKLDVHDDAELRVDRFPQQWPR